MSTGAATAGKDGARKREKPSLRTCIVTRAERPPADLIRFVPGPDGTIVPDLARKLPGRGVWVGCSKATVAAAVARKSFAKALKRQVNVPADLAEQVERLLTARAVSALSFANKAGLLVTGFAKLDAELGKGAVTILIHAAEAAADGSGKLDRKMQAVAAEMGREATIVKTLTIAQLDLATGRENVVHAGLSTGGATDRFSVEVERLLRYRSHDSAPASELTAE